jgi:hypothetical protein
MTFGFDILIAWNLEKEAKIEVPLLKGENRVRATFANIRETCSLHSHVSYSQSDRDSLKKMPKIFKSGPI